LKKAGLTPEPDKATEHAQILLNLQEREALFREFAEYRGAPEPGKAAVRGQVPFTPRKRESLFRQFADYERSLEADNARTLLAPKQHEALFRAFAEYDKTHRVTVAYRDISADH